MSEQTPRDGVLITRPRVSGEGTARAVIARGYFPVVAPLLRIKPRATNLPEPIQAILVASANALRGLPASAAKILAVGDSTAAAATERGFPSVLSAGGDAAALAALAARHLDPSGPPLLLACGSRQGHDLATHLRANGFRVIRRVTYAADPARHFPSVAAKALVAGSLHAGLFMSAETAAVFVRLMPADLRGALSSVVALAIGKPAADALETLPWRNVRLARTPTLDGVLDLL